LKIEKIRLIEVDDSFPLLYPSRSMEIKTSRGNITTPNRGATSYEFNRKKILPTEISVDNPFTVYLKKFTGGDVIRLLTKNDEFEQQVKLIERSDHVSEYSTLHLCSFQLATSSGTGPAPMTTLSEGNNLNEFLSSIIDMQIQANHDIISIPHFNLSLPMLKKTLKTVDETIQKLGKQPFFAIDLRYPDFAEILKFITDDLQSNFVNLIYRKYVQTRNNYRELKNYARKPVAFLMSDVERIDPDHANLSTMHYMPFLGNDLYAVELPPPNIPKKGEAPKPKNLANLKIFDKGELTIDPLINKTIDSATILSQVGNPELDNLKEKLDNVGEARLDGDKYEIINALTKIHELKTSSAEFSTLQIYVKERSSKNYIKSKLRLESRLPRA